MRYSQREDFSTPTPEDLERTRRNMMWLAPLLLIQQAARLFDDGATFAAQLQHVVLWSAMTMTILWLLAGWPMLWMSARDRIMLNDEGQRAIRGEAMRWGMIATVLAGVGLSVADLWIELSSRAAINALVSVATVTAAVRFAWLNRGGPGDDD